MNIVKRELKSNLRSMILWSVAIILLMSIQMIKFESFAGNSNINEFMESLSQGVLSAIGMSNLNIATLEGFISTISPYLYLILGIHAVLLGSSIISKEERDRTVEYLFTLPISRRKVVWNKLISAIINLILLNFVTLAATLISSIRYEKNECFYKFIVLLFLAIFIVQLIFLSIGMLVASINKKYKKSGNISVSILMITFVISSLINMVDSVDILKYITPFKFFDANYILNEGKLELVFIVISLLIIGFGISGTFIFFSKRDLNV
ncbi:MAG: ABC transporter permease [Clostridiaceae bacterium]|nr:ABC transporter permease [Clostridiaceae bacterium]MBW4860889.1 ABC transporter permease [Clostridiaceae bacterium]MBW4867514.1 ABC transporter permease [Clostridiaceae bacterium]